MSGLALGNFLLREGIGCVIFERRSREHVEQRQRAGVIDTRATRVFRKRGLEDRVVGGTPVEPSLGFRVDGQPRPLTLAVEEHREGRFCPQQVLVRNLIAVFEQDGGDLRFDTEVSVEDIDGERPRVRLGDGSIVEGDFIAGCDGNRGASRAALAEDRITRHTHEYGYAWLVVLAEAAATQQAVMAIHRRGFAAQFGRGPRASRFYLQCPLDDTAEDWPDERIWSELETRFGEPLAARGAIVEKQLLPLRGEVISPMSHGRLHLLGDAAHIVPPMSAKGMNLALHDADVFADALIHFYENGDPGPLDSCSETRLREVWNYQAFATWFTDTVHDAGDPSYRGEFRRKVARADFDRLYLRDGEPAAQRIRRRPELIRYFRLSRTIPSSPCTATTAITCRLIWWTAPAGPDIAPPIPPEAGARPTFPAWTATASGPAPPSLGIWSPVRTSTSHSPSAQALRFRPSADTNGAPDGTAASINGTLSADGLELAAAKIGVGSAAAQPAANSARGTRTRHLRRSTMTDERSRHAGSWMHPNSAILRPFAVRGAGPAGGTGRTGARRGHTGTERSVTGDSSRVA